MDKPSYLVPGFLSQFLLHHCLFSAPNLLALLPASLHQDRLGHPDVWHLALIWFQLTLWHLCLWLPLHPNFGIQEFSGWPVLPSDAILPNKSKANSLNHILKVPYPSVNIGLVMCV
jgi:hypothetical protein